MTGHSPRWVFLTILSLWVVGCASSLPIEAPEPRPPLKIQSVLVVPFTFAEKRHEGGGTIRCPVCAAVFLTGQVGFGADKHLTKELIALLRAKTKYSLIPPEAAEGERSKIISQDVRMSERNLLVHMGRGLQADGVISGTIYRFRQRIGTSYSVDTPASVAFDIHFIRVADGRLLWVSHFDETQRSLSENLFKLKTFFRRGGSWLTAEQLATFGLHEIMATFPQH